MNNAARRVLSTQKSLICDNLYFEDSILDDLEQENILNETMVCKIKAERTNNNKITELLFILKRRGPRAFEVFVEAVRKHSKFLAETLEQLYNDEMDKEETAIKAPCTSEEVNNDVSMATNSSSSTSPDAHVCHLQATATNEATQTSDLDLTVGSQYSDSSVNFSTKDGSHLMQQQNLNSLHTKLKSHMIMSSIREPSFASPKPATFQMVDDLVTELLSSNENCYRILHDEKKTFSLSQHIHKLMDKVKELESRFQTSEEKRNKYADNLTKFESKCIDKDQAIYLLKKESEKVKGKLNVLQDRNDELSELLEQGGDQLKQLQDEVDYLSQQLQDKITKHDALLQEYDWCSKELSKKRPGNMLVMGRSPFGDSAHKNHKNHHLHVNGRKSNENFNTTTEANKQLPFEVVSRQNKATPCQDKTKVTTKKTEKSSTTLTDTKTVIQMSNDSKHKSNTTAVPIVKTMTNKYTAMSNDKTEELNGTENQNKNADPKGDLKEKSKMGIFRKRKKTPHISSFQNNNITQSIGNFVTCTAGPLKDIQITNAHSSDQCTEAARRSLSPGRKWSPRQNMPNQTKIHSFKSSSPTRKSVD